MDISLLILLWICGAVYSNCMFYYGTGYNLDFSHKEFWLVIILHLAFGLIGVPATTLAAIYFGYTRK